MRLVKSPALAAKMGRDRRYPLREDWEWVKDQIMREAVLAKFRQHADLQTLLLSTGDAEIIEHTKNDAYWGDGGDGSGLNMLGRILMETRDQLRKENAISHVAGQNPDPALRTVHYVRHEFHAEPVAWTNSLLGFVYDVPYFGPCGIFPPFHLLNDLLRRGGSQGGMSPGVTWEPFELSRQEYDVLVAAVRSSEVELLRSRTRYAFLRFKFDSSFDHLTDYFQWLETVCKEHRARWHAELRDAGFMK